ncbi:MAG: hypothetical protein ACOX3Q_08450 [Clostridia bacterium]
MEIEHLPEKGLEFSHNRIAASEEDFEDMMKLLHREDPRLKATGNVFRLYNRWKGKEGYFSIRIEAYG